MCYATYDENYPDDGEREDPDVEPEPCPHCGEDAPAAHFHKSDCPKYDEMRDLPF